jgi:tRNA-modifying protein YgfZ
MAYSVARDVIVASGTDTTKFLHGQLSQNIETLMVGESKWSLLLQPNGRLIALLRLTRQSDEEILIDTEVGVGERVHAALSRFLIRTKCTLSLTQSVSGIRFSAGPGSPVGLNLPCEPWSGTQTIAWPPQLLPSIESSDSFEFWRVSNGEPRHDVDFVENTLPSETGVLAAAVVFGKGCYVGQELVERIDSRGRIVKALVRISCESDFSATEELFDEEGAQCGHVTSAATLDEAHVGIALVRGGSERLSVRLSNGSIVWVHPLIGEPNGGAST